jgi:LysM repeat protein
VYVVKKGDTLYAIAIRHKVTLEALLAANPTITHPNFVKIGQRILIPAP